MGLIQSKPQHLGAVYADHELSTPLRSTLKDVEHLFIRPQRLKVKEGDQVGAGGYGEVMLATLDKSSRNSREVAVKQLRTVGTKGDRKRLAIRLARELKIWATLQHPNILGLLGYYLSDNYEIAQLISVYMVNGNVSQYLNQHQPDIATRLKFVQGITAGLRYLHDFTPPISHGDLKPGNVLINDGLDAVICDFGVASFITQAEGSSGLTTTRAVKGSLRYMSPELLLGNEVKQTLPSDIWAWACTTYEIFTNIEPYSEVKTNGAMIAEVVHKEIPGSIQVLLSRLPQDETWPTVLSKRINECWNFDSSKRPSVAMLIRATKYPSNQRADGSTELPLLPSGRAGRGSWALVEPLEDIIPNPPGAERLQVILCLFSPHVLTSLAFSRREYPGAPSIIPSEGERAGTRRNFLKRLKLGSRRQKGKKRGTTLPLSEGPQSISLPASRVDAAPDNASNTVVKRARRARRPPPDISTVPRRASRDRRLSTESTFRFSIGRPANPTPTSAGRFRPLPSPRSHISEAPLPALPTDSRTRSSARGTLRPEAVGERRMELSESDHESDGQPRITDFKTEEPREPGPSSRYLALLNAIGV